MKNTKNKLSNKNYFIKRSIIHGTGIYASKDIIKGVKIIEYIGEKISKKEGDRRSAARIKKYLNSKKTGSVYIFELNSKYDIDGSKAYNKARFINHSCNPNCEVEIISGRIWIISRKKIKKDVELTYDYGYEFDETDIEDHKCLCGSKTCVGYIVAKDDRSKLKRFLNSNK